MQNGWVWLGLSNARMSRQPMAIYETVLFRKEMRSSGFEQKFIEQWTKELILFQTQLHTKAQ
jgi:hypothetical protein